MLSGHFLVRGALPSSTSSSPWVSTPVTDVDPPASPVSSELMGTHVPGSIPKRLDLGSESSLKFLILGLMDGTQASSGPCGAGRAGDGLNPRDPTAQYSCRGKLEGDSLPGLPSSRIQMSSS